MFDDISNHVDVPGEAMTRFLRDTSQAQFLFPGKLMTYLNELREDAGSLRANARRHDVAIQRQSVLASQLADREAELCDKVAKAEESLVKHFEPYLDFRTVK